jgi:hypothetical protein
MCIDYHDLNKISIKINCPLPQIDDFLNCLNEACYFSYVNLKSGYYQTHMGKTIMRKKCWLQLALQLNFLVAQNVCNSLYFYIMNANGQIAWVIKLQLIIYIMQIIVTQL